MANRIKFTVTLKDVEVAIENRVNDVSLSGLGADGASEYDIVNVSVVAVDGGFEVEVDAERSEGKFASNDEIREAITDELDSLDDIELEVS